MSVITLPYQYQPRTYQLPAWRHMEGTEEAKRAALVWHRRAGKDLWAINLCCVKSQERIGTYWHLLPTYKQGRAIVWNGFTRDGRKFLDYFPNELIASMNATEMRVTFKNGSIYQVVGTDSIDSLVGTNPIGCVFSEYSLHDPGAWDYIRPIMKENGGWAVFIYTARGKNHGYRMIEMARKQKDRWFSEVLVAGDRGTRRPNGTPVFSDAMIQEERDDGMPEEMVQQEYYCSFEAPLVGSYYGPQMLSAENNNRFMDIPIDPLLPIHTAWDLGVGDSTAIWFIQEYGMEVRLVDYYENSGEGLPHYIKILQDRGYVYGTHYAPHDIEVREFTSGKSRRDTAKSLGVNFRVVGQHDLLDGIEATRSLLPMCWWDQKRCERGIEAVRNYRKEWDEKNKCYRNNPLHDWTSHGCDALRQYAWGRRTRPKARQSPQRTAIDEHEYV